MNVATVTFPGLKEPLMDEQSRKPYQAPQLTALGDLRRVTAAGSVGNFEQINGQGTKSKRPNPNG